MQNITITLLVGGISTERLISKSSSKNIYKALLELGYNVNLVDPAYGLNQPTNPDDFFIDDDIFEISQENYIKAFTLPVFNNTDLVFNGLHGKFGEDGTVQSLMEMKNLKYTGSGVLTSALAMDKCAAKALFKHFDVITPEWLPVTFGNYDLQKILQAIEEQIFYPCIIKPNDQGSTIGLSVCLNSNQVKDALDLAFKYSKKVLVEAFIEGYELTVGIIGERTLPPLEIKPKKELYDYECKYSDGMSDYIVPAPFPETVLSTLQNEALKAYKAVGCTSYARVDFRLDKNYTPYCLEVNTLPGMTSHSLLPMTANAVGINFNNLIDLIIKHSLNEN